MASWSRSKSGSSGYVETEFQKAVCKLTFEEFVDRTNIREIVENGFQKAALERNICNAAISAEQLKEYMKHYYDRRHKTRRWQSSELKNLKWKSAAVKSESAQSTVIAQSTISDANGDTVEPVEGRQRRKSVERQSVRMLYISYFSICSNSSSSIQKEIVDTQVRIKLTDKAEVSKEQAKAVNTRYYQQSTFLYSIRVRLFVYFYSRMLLQRKRRTRAWQPKSTTHALSRVKCGYVSSVREAQFFLRFSHLR